MMATRLASSSLAKLSRGQNSLSSRFSIFTGQKNHHRFMSVTVLEDLDATEKFCQLNHKSVLYFTATWCPPCKAIKPVYEEMSKKHTDVAFGKVDVDDNSDAAVEHQISAVPTFIFFDGEDPVQRFSGADPAQLEAFIKDLEAR